MARTAIDNANVRKTMSRFLFLVGRFNHDITARFTVSRAARTLNDKPGGNYQRFSVSGQGVPPGLGGVAGITPRQAAQGIASRLPIRRRLPAQLGPDGVGLLFADDAGADQEVEALHFRPGLGIFDLLHQREVLSQIGHVGSNQNVGILEGTVAAVFRIGLQIVSRSRNRSADDGGDLDRALRHSDVRRIHSCRHGRRWHSMQLRM